MNKNVDFTTPRLLLSLLTLTDREFILKLVNSAGWLRFIGDRNIKSVSDADAYINRINENSSIKYWVVALKHNKTPIGIITYIKRDYLEFPDIGFAFLPSYSKSGYAFEAGSVVLNYIPKNQLSERILAITIPDNVTSIRLLEKLGFDFNKEVEVEGQNLLVYARKLSFEFVTV